MYQAFFALYPNFLLRFGFLCINISDPGGAIGVASKWYSLSIAGHADTGGFCLHALTIFKLKYICGRSLHQYAIGKFGGNDANVDFEHNFYVWMDCSAGFPRCTPGGVYCCFVCWLAMKSSTSFDVSLFILWSLGLNPLLSQYAYISLYALNKSSFLLLFSGIPLIKLGSLM